jgi:hypothetical protein
VKYHILANNKKTAKTNPKTIHATSEMIAQRIIQGVDTPHRAAIKAATSGINISKASLIIVFSSRQLNGGEGGT